MAYQINIANREINPRVINFFTFENQVTTLEFTLDNYIYDEVDLRNYKAYAVTSIKGSVDLTELEMNYDEVDDKLILTWNVGDYTLTQEGAIVYQITFKQNENDGEDSAVWYSYKAIMINRSTVDADYKIVAEYPTIMAQWLKKMDDLYSEVSDVRDNAISDITAIQQELEKYATDFTNSVFYIPYDETIPVEERLDGRLYFQYTDAERTKGRFEDPEGNSLVAEAKGGSPLPMFAPIWSDHLYNDASYLRADNFSWHNSSIYVTGYNKLLKEYNSAKVQMYQWRDADLSWECFTLTETPSIGDPVFWSGSINSTFKKAIVTSLTDDILTVTSDDTGNVLSASYVLTGKTSNMVPMYPENVDEITVYSTTTANGFKIADASQEEAILNLYLSDEKAWYYILDTENARFKLPREKKADGKYLYFFVGSYEREEGEVNIGVLTEIANGQSLEEIIQDVNTAKDNAIAEIDNRQIPLNVISETSGVITLSTNKIYTMEINADTEFTLPTEVNTSFFNQIKVMAKIVGTPVITWGTSYFANKTTPELEEGVYDLYFDYDNHLADWVVGVVSKGLAE